MAAINRSFAVIEFDLEGRILTANDNFLRLMGYSMEEVLNAHHRIFYDRDYAAGPAYHQFWKKLGSGEFDEGEYRRIARDRHEVWIQATYNPILDADGRPYKIMKVAMDVTGQRRFRPLARGSVAAGCRADRAAGAGLQQAHRRSRPLKRGGR